MDGKRMKIKLLITALLFPLVAFGANTNVFDQVRIRNILVIGAEAGGVASSITPNGTTTSNLTVYNLATVSNLTVQGTFTGTVIGPRAMLRASTHDGYGSTDTFIPRMLITITNTGQGTAWNYVTNAVNGTTITILQNGIYSMSGTFCSALNDSTSIGFTVNASGAELTDTATSANITNRLVSVNVGAVVTQLQIPGVSGTFCLSSNDVIRPHSDGATPAAAQGCYFSITKVNN